MKFKTEIKYFLIYLVLNLIGFYIASIFWWTDGLNLSFLRKESFCLVLSVGICWIGIYYLSILIIRKLIVNFNTPNFIGPIDLLSNEFYRKEIGIKNSNKFRNAFNLIAFPLLILTIFGFVYSMRIYKKNQLKKYGKIESITVENIQLNIKKMSYVYFKYNNGKDSTFLDNYENNKIGDRIKIIYSAANPKIIEQIE